MNFKWNYFFFKFLFVKKRSDQLITFANEQSHKIYDNNYAWLWIRNIVIVRRTIVTRLNEGPKIIWHFDHDFHSIVVVISRRFLALKTNLNRKVRRLRRFSRSQQFSDHVSFRLHPPPLPPRPFHAQKLVFWFIMWTINKPRWCFRSFWNLFWPISVIHIHRYIWKYHISVGEKPYRYPLRGFGWKKRRLTLWFHTIQRCTHVTDE